MSSPMPRPLGSSLDTWFQMQKFLPSPGHHIGANSRAEWRHLSLQIFPKLCQDTLSLCDPTEHMSRFLKLIIDVLGKTALEVREFFFLLFLFLFFFPIVFSLLLWKGWGSPSAAPELPARPPLAHLPGQQPRTPRLPALCLSYTSVP